MPLRGPLTLHANVVNAAGEFLGNVIISGAPSEQDWSDGIQASILEELRE